MHKCLYHGTPETKLNHNRVWKENEFRKLTIYPFFTWPLRQILTRALLGLWIFHRLLGGGRLNAPPPWSRLLVAVEKNQRQRSKAREKSFRNHFGHFFAQVKIGVSRGQNSKIFQNGISTIKSLILKRSNEFDTIVLVSLRRVEPYIKWLWKVKVKVWPQVKSGQSHVMTEMGHIAYHSIRLAKTNVLTPIPRLYLFLIKSYWQITVGDLGWPQMTFGGVGNAIFYSNYPQLSYTIWLHSKTLAPK